MGPSRQPLDLGQRRPIRYHMMVLNGWITNPFLFGRAYMYGPYRRRDVRLKVCRRETTEWSNHHDLVEELLLFSGEGSIVYEVIATTTRSPISSFTVLASGLSRVAMMDFCFCASGVWVVR